LIGVVLLLGSALCPLTAYANVIFSEDFSSSTSPDTAHIADNEKWGPNTEYYLFPTDPRWSLLGTSVLVINPADGDRAMALNEAPEHGLASVLIHGFTPNKPYLLMVEHWGDDRPNTTSYEVDVLIDVTNIGHISRAYSNPGPGATSSFPFTATANSHTLTFRDVTFNGQASAILDNICIADTVPEPSAYALTLVGLAMLGMTARRHGLG
jgi:hypothetical protein